MPGDELRLRLNSSAYANLANADAGHPRDPSHIPSHWTVKVNVDLKMEHLLLAS